MARRTFAAIAPLLASLALLTACAASGAKQGLDDVAALSQRIDHVRQSSELAGQKVDAAVKSLQTIARSDFSGNPWMLYADFERSVEASERQADELRSSIDQMKSEANELFRSWRGNLATFAEEPLRRRSEERQAVTRERLESVVLAAETAETGCDAVNRTLRDYVAYMRYDFNAASLAMIQAEIAALAQCATTLAARFTACQDAAKSYVEAASFRSATPSATAEPERESPKGG
jgi:ElaB/YqjD/DUF883 family membrane-anchored ribosome-binding protein